MKFYYNGKLMRTSKTRTYTHAVLKDGRLVSCASSRELAEKAMASSQSINRHNLLSAYAELGAIESGKSYFYAKDINSYNRSRKYIVRNSPAELKKRIEAYENWLNNGWEVVALEAR